MSNWIKEAAAKVQEEKKRQETNKALETATREALFANAPAVFDKLSLTIEKDVEAFNQEFTAPEQKLDFERPTAILFTVTRRRGIHFVVMASLKQQEFSIVCAIERPNMVNGVPYAVQEVFHWKMDGDSLVLLQDHTPITYEEASKKLLLPAFEHLL